MFIEIIILLVNSVVPEPQLRRIVRAHRKQARIKVNYMQGISRFLILKTPMSNKENLHKKLMLVCPVIRALTLCQWV